MAGISSVERRASTTCAFLLGKLPEPRPHTRVEDEGAVERKYAFGSVLGQGSFGLVKEVTCQTSGECFAVKIVNKDKPGSRSILLLSREVEVLKRLDHPHIIQLEEVLETPKKMYLVMELCTGGELTTQLKQKGYFKEEEAKEVMKQLADVVVYLHDNDIVHRDLKLENILLKSPVDSTGTLHIKVTDFGLAHMRNLSDMEDPMDQRCGTPYYMAPEVISNRHEYTKMCDVWSLGVIMYYLLCGRVPFHGDTVAKLEESILHGELKFKEVEWIRVSDRGKSLTKGMLCKDTTQRLTARRVLDDTWFTGQSANFLSAIDLMRDMTGESDRQSMTSSCSTSLETVAETEEGKATEEPKKNRTRRVSPQKVLDKRTKSTSTLAAPNPSQLKFASTSSLSGSRSPKQRSYSVGTRPATMQARRTSAQHGHDQNMSAHHKERKHSSNSLSSRT